MKTLHVMRGLPGAGKSTYIRKHFPNAFVASADNHFIGRDGVYRFDPRKLGAAHDACFRAVKRAMQNGVESIVLDNTNTQVWEWAAYASIAKDFGYQVKYVNIFDAGLSDKELAARNTHGVPLEAIRRMRARWEETPE